MLLVASLATIKVKQPLTPQLGGPYKLSTPSSTQPVVERIEFYEFQGPSQNGSANGSFECPRVSSAKSPRPQRSPSNWHTG
jgi:hypothetical protein